MIPLTVTGAAQSNSEIVSFPLDKYIVSMPFPIGGTPWIHPEENGSTYEGTNYIVNEMTLNPSYARLDVGIATYDANINLTDDTIKEIYKHQGFKNIVSRMVDNRSVLVGINAPNLDESTLPKGVGAYVFEYALTTNTVVSCGYVGKDWDVFNTIINNFHVTKK